MYVHSGMHFCRYFNEFEKINTHIYIVFQIDKNITILTIFNPIRSGLFQTVNDPGGGGL